MGHVLSAPITSKLCSRKGKGGLRVGGAEMQGFRINMEDAHNIEMGLENHPNVTLVGVYDGHAGDQASKFLSENLPAKINALEDVFDAESVVQAVKDLDREFMENDEVKNHGSTCVFALLQPIHDENTSAADRSWRVLASNVGDSRVFIVRANGEIVSMTSDHKPEDDIENARIVAAGGHVNMNRVDGQLAMSRAIGDWQYKTSTELSVEDQKVIPVAVVTNEVAYVGDRIVVCCDGIVEQMTNEEAGEFVHTEMAKVENFDDHDPVDIASRLLHHALNSGSKDNMSAYVIVVSETDTFGDLYDRKDDEFVAGPVRPHSDDKTFMDAYIADAKKHGYEGEELYAMAAKAEAELPPEAFNPPPQENGNGLAAGGGGDMGSQLGLLSQLFGPGGGNDPAKLASFFQMLQQNGGIEMEEDDETEGSGGVQVQEEV